MRPARASIAECSKCTICVNLKIICCKIEENNDVWDITMIKLAVQRTVTYFIRNSVIFRNSGKLITHEMRHSRAF